MSNITPLNEILNTHTDNTKGFPMPNEKSIIIFLVDDNELYLRLLENQFRENKDLVIKTFLTGEACLANISLKPDVIVLDYFLDTKDKSAMDGLQTLLLVKEASPGTQVIMSSAHESAETAVNCLKHGAFDYIVKDKKTFFKLKQIIKKILGIHSKEKELIIWDW